METEEIIKLVDGIYKNILEKFNPGARQLISAGKAYLKALHGASTASNVFNEALAKIAVNAQQGGTIDIGSALMNIVGVYKEIQDQHMNILKAFYVDLLVPLETNLEKDTKVVQFEQKKFLQQHKMRSDSYSKAAATMKKYRKKNSKNTPKEAEKEIKSIQAFEEEKHKLDQFCEQSLKNAMTQERRRYGFVLERQCSLAKHWMAYHHSGHMIIEKSLDNWNDVAATREFLPPNVENMFSAKQALRDVEDEDDDDRESIASQLRKTRSIDASCLDMRSLADVANSTLQMPRAKSEFNLNNNTGTLLSGHHHHHHHHNHHAMMMMGGGGGGGAGSMIGGATNGKPDISHWERPTVKALYAYLSSGENQLSFLEGDRIALVGDRAKGWQFGENLRTQKFGWFPIAYTETERDDKESISEWVKAPASDIELDHTPDTSLESTLVDDSLSKMTGSYHGGEDASPTRMFGDTIQYRQSKQFRRLSRGEKPPKPGPPPQLPAPVPTPVVPNSYSGGGSKQQQQQRHDGASGSGGIPQSNSFSSAGAPPMASDKRKSGSATMNFSKPPASSNPKQKRASNGMASASLHSSNDSGFSNEPQPQPEADLYSDEEPVNRVPIRSARSEKNLLNDQTTMTRSGGRDSSVPSPRYHDEDDIYGTIVPPRPRGQQSQMMMRQANSYGNIAESNSGTLEYGYRTRNRGSGSEGQPNQSDSQKIKRTKSFWKFSKSEDHILEGMAMWKHNDIIPTGREKREMEKKEATLKRNMRKKEQLEKQKQKEMIAAKAEEEQQQQQQQQRRKDNSRGNANGMMDNESNTSTLVRGNNRESRDRDRDQRGEPMRERPHSIALMSEQEKFPITKSDIDKRISKIDQEFHQQQKKASRGGQEEDRGGRSGRDRGEGRDRKQSKGGKNDTNNNNNSRHSYAGEHLHHQEQELYGEAPMGGGKHGGKQDKYRTTERETSKNRNNDALNKYYQDQTFDDFSIIPADSIMMQDTSFYDDDGMMDDMMLMKTVRRKEILKQYYSSGTDTERNSSSSDPYDCIVVDDHLVAKGRDRKSNGGQDGTMMRMMNDRRGDKKDRGMPDDKMAFSTFRGGVSGGNGGRGQLDDDDDDTMMASMTLDDELMEEEQQQQHHHQQQQQQQQQQSRQQQTRDRRSKSSKGNLAESKYESEHEARISAKMQSNGQQQQQQQKRKSTKSIASDGKAYGPWYDLWGADSSVHNQKL
ncbi:protein piccolo [Anopheles gambiae]|uniref:protein piccolo n=1 Tax=Anopheles gambiae TaxID=7165 RepID=UPI002AC8D7EB|nr:protein piccolo [Anopheles gambiae]XP_061499015.1 protein piccolo [Anopheles gambiae]XP_061499016.1 protein piccolo [Anopheles gambiae]